MQFYVFFPHCCTKNVSYCDIRTEVLYVSIILVLFFFICIGQWKTLFINYICLVGPCGSLMPKFHLIYQLVWKFLNSQGPHFFSLPHKTGFTKNYKKYLLYVKSTIKCALLPIQICKRWSCLFKLCHPHLDLMCHYSLAIKYTNNCSWLEEMKINQ